VWCSYTWRPGLLSGAPCLLYADTGNEMKHAGIRCKRRHFRFTSLRYVQAFSQNVSVGSWCGQRACRRSVLRAESMRRAPCRAKTSASSSPRPCRPAERRTALSAAACAPRRLAEGPPRLGRARHPHELVLERVWRQATRAQQAQVSVRPAQLPSSCVGVLSHTGKAPVRVGADRPARARHGAQCKST